MFIDFFRTVFSLSNLLLWKEQLITVLCILFFCLLFLMIILKRITRKKKGYWTTFLNALSPGLSFFLCFLSMSYILNLLNTHLNLNSTINLYYSFTSSALTYLGLTLGLLIFFHKIFKAEKISNIVTKSVQKIAKISHNGVNFAIIIGNMVLYTRYIWKHIPKETKSTIWIQAVMILNSLILISVLFYLFQKLLPMITKYFEQKLPPHKIILIFLYSISIPLKILLLTLFVGMLKDIFQMNTELTTVISLSMKLTISIALLYFLYKIVDSILFSISKYSEKDNNSLDKTLIEMLRMITGIIFLVITAIIVIRLVTGKPLNSLLAGLGIGGLAVALAAQDTLKNFFGSLMIMADKPFKIGERIVAEGFDGNIESIGFRSTRIRTLTGNQVIIPNDKIAQVPVENIGKRKHIRRLTNITITYNTPIEKIEKALEIIRNILKDHEGSTEEFPPKVYFNEFNSDSLNIQVIYWYSPPSYWDYLAFSEKVNLQIMKEFNKEGIEFAFPTNTTYLEQNEGKSIKLDLGDFKKK